jgi:CheY-like chemotaxis protein
VKETSLRILIAEDSPDDAELLLRALHAGGYLPQHRVVKTGPDMLAALKSQDWDLVISDHNMPGFGAMEALKIVRHSRSCGSATSTSRSSSSPAASGKRPP